MSTQQKKPVAVKNVISFPVAKFGKPVIHSISNKNSRKGSTTNTHNKALPNTREIYNREKYLKKRHADWFGPVEKSRLKHGICRNCVICRGIECTHYVNRPEDWNEPSRSIFNITMIMAASSNRIRYLLSFKKLWDGPVNTAIQVFQKQLNSSIALIQRLNLPSSYIVILYPVAERGYSGNNFPINYLRNIAIRNVHTSHFLVIDADMRPSANMLMELSKMPTSLKNNEKAAIIIPSVFLRVKDKILNNCRTFEECDKESMKYIPRTKNKLSSCYLKGICTFRKEAANSHLYVNQEWIDAPANRIFKLNCFPSRFQEPYVLVKYTNQTALFDERFIDYGCNKVQYIDHLRFLGYQYYIVTSAFVTDIIHHPSAFREKFNLRYSSTGRPDMTIVCFRYLEKLASLYGNNKDVLPICTHKHSVTYSRY